MKGVFGNEGALRFFISPCARRRLRCSADRSGRQSFHCCRREREFGLQRLCERKFRKLGQQGLVLAVSLPAATASNNSRTCAISSFSNLAGSSPACVRGRISYQKQATEERAHAAHFRQSSRQASKYETVSSVSSPMLERRNVLPRSLPYPASMTS